MTTVSDENHSLGGHYHEGYQLYQEEPCTSAGVSCVKKRHSGFLGLNSRLMDKKTGQSKAVSSLTKYPKKGEKQ
jgi:hypothetical protein